MLKIYPLDYYRLTNGEHYALMIFFEESLKDFPIVEETFPKAVELFLEAKKNEGHALQQIDRPLQSAEIHAADEERIRYFRMLRDWAKLKQKEDDPAIVEAAEIIVQISDDFGGSAINSQSVNARTTSLTFFIRRLEEDYLDEVHALNLQHFLAQLNEANHHYTESYMERNFNDAESEYGMKATKRARQSCDFALKTLFSMINDKIRLGEGEIFEDFVNFINVQINNNRITLGQGPGGRPPRRRKKEE